MEAAVATSQCQPGRRDVPAAALGYFFIGVGFMLAEIALLQCLSVAFRAPDLPV
ncbi:MAG: hypothetical protein R3B89_00960 [Polyangiaceae bacterium]